MFKWMLLSWMIAAQTPSVEEIISNSTKLIVRKERAQALELLSEALQRKNLNKSQKERLHQGFKVAAEIFFTDRGQGLYESGRSSYFSSPSEAESRFADALILEKENVLVRWALVKTHLKNVQCDQSKSEFEKLPKIIQEEKHLFAPLKAYCGKQSLPFWSDEKAPVYLQHFLKGIFLFWKGASHEALAELQKAKKAQPDFPETFYWIWKIDSKDTDAVARYKRDCETQKVQMMKKFEEFPQVCQFLTEVAGLEFNHEI